MKIDSARLGDRIAEDGVGCNFLSSRVIRAPEVVTDSTQKELLSAIRSYLSPAAGPIGGLTSHSVMTSSWLRVTHLCMKLTLVGSLLSISMNIVVTGFFAKYSSARFLSRLVTRLRA